MIRVKKRREEPETLKSKGYKDDSVKRIILDDQDNKCYICERKVTTDYEVEHLSSQSNNKDLINEWNNLFIACNYCNNKKKNLFDSIKHPDTYNVEDVISHQFDQMHERVNFITNSTDPDVLLTVSLLERMFNGTNAPVRNLMETRFYNQFKSGFNHFQSVVHDYLHGHKDEMRPIIESMIDRKSEYLAFKYAIIMQNANLRKDFGNLIIWNKQ